MKLKATEDTDVQLVAMMVAKILETEHQIDEAPAFADYQVLNDKIRHNGATDIRVAVPLGRGVSIDVMQHWWAESDRDLREITEAATGIAGGIDWVRQGQREIVDMTKEVRAAVSREITKAKRCGLVYRLISVQPNAIRDNVREDVAIDVIFERLSEYLRPERAIFVAECVGDVVRTFQENRDQQEQRVARRLHLDAAGATGRIDSVVVNAMREAGHDVAEVLRLLATTDDWIVDIGHRADEPRRFLIDKNEGGGKTFRLHWSNGDVFAQLALGDGVSWLKGRLTFLDAPISLAKAKGRRVRDIIDNPIFGDARITSGGGKKGEYATLDCTQDLLNFDSETGRLWAA